MTTDIKKSAPPPVPPRHNKEYYEDNEQPTKKNIIKKDVSEQDMPPPVAPQRISSKISSIYGNDSLTIEKEFSASNLLDSKDSCKIFEK